MNKKEEQVDPKFEGLLEYIKTGRGFDFTGYKRPGLERRVRRRMEIVGIEDFPTYQDFLEVHPEEFTHLFNTILINVTGFFRDTPTWEYVAQTLIPRMLESKGADGAVRVWSAGCATGEEAFTAAMLLIEALGAEQFISRVKVFGTDVDDEALNHARQATYSQAQVEGIPAEMREKYFEQSCAGFT